jgi:hypothetical protein
MSANFKLSHYPWLTMRDEGRYWACCPLGIQLAYRKKRTLWIIRYECYIKHDDAFCLSPMSFSGMHRI